MGPNNVTTAAPAVTTAITFANSTAGKECAKRSLLRGAPGSTRRGSCWTRRVMERAGSRNGTRGLGCLQRQWASGVRSSPAGRDTVRSGAGDPRVLASVKRARRLPSLDAMRVWIHWGGSCLEYFVCPGGTGEVSNGEPERYSNKLVGHDLLSTLPAQLALSRLHG